ncbi:MAG TPA: phosphoribosylglycinamide formyltransferase [Steroidobacteraceae bacterium]|nr:phosphoribosylglycinamide formyltransferase [Steroidobacteraceae bacterium]
MARQPAFAIVISGRGSNMAAIVRASRSGRLPAAIAVVIADREAPGISLAQSLGIPTRIIPARDFHDRSSFDMALARALDQSGVQFIALAGFMRILTGEFVDRFRGQLVNIHPSLLPRHRGLHTHRQALATGDDRHGASVHFVTAELDGGPVIAQASLPILPTDTESTLSARVHRLEHILYPRVCGWLAAGRVVLDADRVIFDGKPLPQSILDESALETFDVEQ